MQFAQKSLVKRKCWSKPTSRASNNVDNFHSFGIVGIATSKASVAAFLLRITIISWHKWVLYVTLFSVSTTCFICALFDYIRCNPIESIWNPLIEATCWMSASEFTTLSLVVGGAECNPILSYQNMFNLK